jgi:apolipoprotein N-acyltransferase
MEICKDMDFPKLSREYGKDGTALLIVPAWDFVLDGRLNGRMAILRGVESGFTAAQENERNRIARELHDDIGQSLCDPANSNDARIAAGFRNAREGASRHA